MAVEMEDGRKLICRYDVEGLRHETEENGRMIRFIYSERDVVCEETDDNITRYIRGNGRIVASDSENTRTYYHYACDRLGSITHVIAGNNPVKYVGPSRHSYKNNDVKSGTDALST